MPTYSVTLSYRLHSPSEHAAATAEYGQTVRDLQTDPEVDERSRAAICDAMHVPQEIERERFEIEADDENEAIAEAVRRAGDAPDGITVDEIDD